MTSTAWEQVRLASPTRTQDPRSRPAQLAVKEPGALVRAFPEALAHGAGLAGA